MTAASQVSLSHKASYAPSEGVKTLRPVSECPNTFPGGSFATQLVLKGRRLHNKKHYPSSQNQLLIGPYPYLAQKPDYAKQSLDFLGHPLVLMPSALCTS